MKFLGETNFRVSQITSFGVSQSRPQVFLVLDKFVALYFWELAIVFCRSRKFEQNFESMMKSK